MAPPLITITRQFGAGGSEIAQRAARALHWTVLDNEFVNEVAKRAGLQSDEVARLDERAPSLVERVSRTLSISSPELFNTGETSVPRVEAEESTVVRLTEHIIREAAVDGRCVLVGRGAQAILAQRPDALHVLVVASKTWRMQHAIAVRHIDPVQADRIVEETDRERDRYVKSHYGRARQDPANYDLVVNTEKLGIDGAADLVVAAARNRWQ